MNHMYSAELGGAAWLEQEEVLQDWAEFLDLQFVSVELAEQQLQLMQSGYIDNFLGIIPINFLLQTVGFIAGMMAERTDVCKFMPLPSAISRLL